MLHCTVLLCMVPGMNNPSPPLPNFPIGMQTSRRQRNNMAWAEWGLWSVPSHYSNQGRLAASCREHDFETRDPEQDYRRLDELLYKPAASRSNRISATCVHSSAGPYGHARRWHGWRRWHGRWHGWRLRYAVQCRLCPYVRSIIIRVDVDDEWGPELHDERRR